MHGQREYKCDGCGKPFTSAGNLERHISAIHSDGLRSAARI